MVTTRLDGEAWGRVPLDAGTREAVAHELGQVMRRVHALPVPVGPHWTRDWVAELRSGCVERHRRWGSLAPALVDEIESYLRRWEGAAGAMPADVSGAGERARCVVHADLHGEHVFVSTPVEGSAERAHLAGIIDWGDAIACDPHYELPALHLGTFMGDKRLLRAYLDGYGWPVGPDFARRAMAMTVLHEFDVLDKARALMDRHAPRCLAEVATLLWALE
ncbi:MAG: phosphotransferase family protein [Chloroflexota bacterium]